MVSPRLWVVAGLGAALSEPCDREGEPLPPGLVPVPLRVEGRCWARGASAPALFLLVRRGDAASALHPKFHWRIFHSDPCESGGVCQAVSNGSRLGETWASVAEERTRSRAPHRRAASYESLGGPSSPVRTPSPAPCLRVGTWEHLPSEHTPLGLLFWPQPSYCLEEMGNLIFHPGMCYQMLHQLSLPQAERSLYLCCKKDSFSCSIFCTESGGVYQAVSNGSLLGEMRET